MFGLKRRRSGRDVVAALHGRIVDASRDPALYLSAGVPDTTEGRFESLVLHLLLVLRRLKALPPPADELAQELVDAAFAHLEIALRELGVGDFGVPKRMKKLGQAFYDRTAAYDRLLSAGDAASLAAEIANRADPDVAPPVAFARYLLAGERDLARRDLDALLSGPIFTGAADLGDAAPSQAGVAAEAPR